MATVHDVAKYILEKRGSMSAMKLQKLVYYSQAWSLVWDERPMFNERIEAWANGPVSPDLYDVHRGGFKVENWPFGDTGGPWLDQDARDTLEAVLKFYGHHTAQYLSDLTHREQPWIQAREGLQPWERGDKEITHESMMEYYSSL